MTAQYALLARAGMFLALADLTGCAQFQAKPPASISDLVVVNGDPIRNIQEVKTGKKVQDIFVVAIQTAASAPRNPTSAQEMLDTGLAAINVDCDRYLADLGTANQNALNARQQTTILGGFITTIMGLYGSPTADVTAVSALASGAASSQDVSNSIFLFTDAYKSISKIVHDAQAAFVGDLQKQDASALTYSQATGVLVRYANLCQPTEIRRLIDESIQAAQIVAKPSAGTVDPASQELADVLEKLTKSLSRNVIEGDAIVLYAWYSHPEKGAENKPSTRDQIQQTSPFMKQLDASTLQNLNGVLTPIFAPLSIAGDPLAARWSQPSIQVLPSDQREQAKAAAIAAATAAASVPSPGAKQASVSIMLPPVVHVATPSAANH